MNGKSWVVIRGRPWLLGGSQYHEPCNREKGEARESRVPLTVGWRRVPLSVLADSDSDYLGVFTDFFCDTLQPSVVVSSS
jgi:hypothetical protein